MMKKKTKTKRKRRPNLKVGDLIKFRYQMCRVVPITKRIDKNRKFTYLEPVKIYDEDWVASCGIKEKVPKGGSGIFMGYHRHVMGYNVKCLSCKQPVTHGYDNPTLQKKIKSGKFESAPRLGEKLMLFLYDGKLFVTVGDRKILE